MKFIGRQDYPIAAWGILELFANNVDGRIRECRAQVEARQVTAMTIAKLVEEQFAAPEAAMLAGHMSEEDILRAKQEIMAAMGIYTQSPEPDVYTDGSEFAISAEDRARRYYWPLMRKRLERNYPSGVVDSIDAQSEAVLTHLHNPRDPGNWRTMGLVVGHVQSGKTTNYSALIAKAADAGYRLIIVFSGIYNDLRHQTQERLDEEFSGYHAWHEKGGQIVRCQCGVGTDAGYDKSRAPQCATTLDADFQGLHLDAEERPWLFVIKKTPPVFKKLLNWLSNNVARKNEWSLLVIDDEADQASINTRDEKNATATNACIRQVLQLFPRAAFVGYTATPFANTFINAKFNSEELGFDIFPRNFIIGLPTPANYFGPTQFFGDEDGDCFSLYVPLDPKAAANWISQPAGRRRRGRSCVTGKLPETVVECLHQFVLSTALRALRVQSRQGRARDVGTPFLCSSMLVHASCYVADQKKIARQVAQAAEALRAALDAWRDGLGEDDETFPLLRRLFERQLEVTEEIENVRGDRDLSVSWELPDTFEDLIPALVEVAEDLSLRMINGEPAKMQPRLIEAEAISELRARIEAVIFIGGNKLSRGLTLPGLCVSVFLRGSVMYDTLLQMGRWFGYRDGYTDLCRLCTTPVIYERFRLINEAFEDFRNEVAKMNAMAKTPLSYRLSILRHPGLLITARNKMKNATEAVMTFSGQILEHRKLALDAGLVRANLKAVTTLLDRAKDCGACTYASAEWKGRVPAAATDASTERFAGPRPKGRLWQRVPAEDVLAFLEAFSATEAGAEISLQGLIRYIRNKLSSGGLTEWNVFLPGVPADNAFGTTYSERESIHCPPEMTMLSLRSLKAGGHEYAAVDRKLYEHAARTALPKGRAPANASERKRLFESLRVSAGQLAPNEGNLILYLLTSPDLRRHPALAPDLRNGAPKPLPTYYLWLPKSVTEDGIQNRSFNQTVRETADDIDDLDADDDEI